MASRCLIFLLSFIFSSYSYKMPADFNPSDYPPKECYNSQLRIGKSTLATTDSYRDTENLQLILPESKLEYIPHFHQDECARASKLYLPFTCFKLHQPQTWQLEEGYLSIKTLENEYSKKFYAVINNYSDYEFDAFFDNNIGFWVQDLEKYFRQINDHSDVLTHYIGLKWFHSDLNQTFYSLIIQSPNSQRVIEFIAMNKPNLSSFSHLRSTFEWKQTSIIRASFKQYPKGEYPWTGYLGMEHKMGHNVLPTIVPVKVSIATANIEEQIEFYTNFFESSLLDSNMNVLDDLDSVTVSYAFLQPKEGFIEIQIIQRPNNYTYGQFTVERFGHLVKKTHNDRISGQYCGIDRFFDNHIGFDSTMLEADNSYFDRLFFKVSTTENVKFRLYYTGHQKGEGFESDDYDSEDIDESDELYKYRLIVFDADGTQSIQIIGKFDHTHMDFKQPPVYNKQWCADSCPYNLEMGKFDFVNTDLYKENVSDVVYQMLYGIHDNENGQVEDQNAKEKELEYGNREHAMFDHFDLLWLILIIPVGLVLICCFGFLIHRCRQTNPCIDRNDAEIYFNVQETQCLMNQNNANYSA